MPRITLASLDLFWLIEQANYLQKVGYLRGYYSTRLRTQFENIRPEFSHSCYPAHYALRIWQMYLQSVTGTHGYLQVCRGFDFWLRSTIEWDTDLLAIISGVGLHTFRRAKKRGIMTVVECGSTHTDYQHEIVLAELQRNGINRPLFPKAYRDRVKAEFKLADYIHIPSDFVARTFVEHGVNPDKLLLAPYGTNLEIFQPKTKLDEARPFRVICPSGINLRKGARVLVEAWRKLNWKDAELVWIGAVGPETRHLFRTKLPGLQLLPMMPHRQLAELYRLCDVCVLPSFEEGLARVLVEAASCGLPLIATPNTGVENIFTPGAPEGWLIPVNAVDALCEALIEAKENREKTFALGQRASQKTKSGWSWDDYGKKALANYQKILGEPIVKAASDSHQACSTPEISTMPRITLASLDLFHIINQAQYFQKVGALAGYYTTRLRPEIEKIQSTLAHNCYPAHYALRAWQMHLQTLTGTHGYLQICRGFDLWLHSAINWNTALLAILSGVGLHTFRAAKKRGIVTVVDCGSTHTDYQNEIVLAEFRRNGINRPLFPKAYRDRVKAEFELADYIQVPSDFVARTFIEHGVDPRKLLLAPYGTNLEIFQPKTGLDEARPFRVICPSGVNLRKGARVLMEAWRKLGWKDAELIWIGIIEPGTEHLFTTKLPGLQLVGMMPHKQLAGLYRSCDVFVLPSFEEGLARVMLEAASSGLPLIATPNTGVENFFTPGDPEGWLIPVNAVDALCEALIEAKANRERTFALGQRASLKTKTGWSWDDYGKRALANYERVLA